MRSWVAAVVLVGSAGLASAEKVLVFPSDVAMVQVHVTVAGKDGTSLADL
jgi:hypothetical protein